MIGTLFGILTALVIVVYGAMHVTNQYFVFLDLFAILLVLGGTLVIAFITFPAKEVFKLIKICLTVLRREHQSGNVVAKEIVELARFSRGEVPALQQKLSTIQHPFLKDAVGLIIDRLDAADLESILTDRIRMKQEVDASASNMLRTLAKYPPSLGIVGTVLGLIGVMQQIGGDGGAEKIGPAMAVGMVATLYGLLFTNVMLQPLGENLALRSSKEIRKRKMILMGVMLLKGGRPLLVIQESLNSHLPIEERMVETGGTQSND